MGLILCGCGHLKHVGQQGQKSLDLGHAHVSRVAHAAGLRCAPEIIKKNLIEVYLLCCEAIVHTPNPLVHLIKQAACRQFICKMYRHGPDVSTGFCGLHFVSHQHSEVNHEKDVVGNWCEQRCRR